MEEVRKKQKIFSAKATFKHGCKKIVAFLMLITLVCGSGYPLFVTEAQAATVSRQYGDVNWDGQIDSRDTNLILQHISASEIAANKKKHPDWILTGDDYKVADVNGDGKIDSRDNLRVLEYIAASTIPSIRAKHPDWVSYLNRKYSYTVSVTLSTNSISIDSKGKTIKSIAATHNYGRSCYYVFRAVGAYGYKKRNDGWNKAYTTHTFSLMGTKAGKYTAVIDLYDAKKDIKIASSNAFTINVGEGSSAISVDKKITVFRQNIDKYKVAYGTNENGKKMTLYTSGCGVFAIVNAVYYLKNTKIDPLTLAKFALSTNDIEKRDGKLYKLRYPGGNSDNLAQVFCGKKGSTYGIKFVTSVGSLSGAKAYLKNGYVAVAHVNGHFIALVNYNSKNEKYLVIDSYPSGNRGTSKGYRWMTAKQFTGKMALAKTSYNHNLPIHIIGRR